jgi:hypothetical protein
MPLFPFYSLIPACSAPSTIQRWRKTNITNQRQDRDGGGDEESGQVVVCAVKNVGRSVQGF